MKKLQRGFYLPCSLVLNQRSKSIEEIKQKVNQVEEVEQDSTIPGFDSGQQGRTNLAVQLQDFDCPLDDNVKQRFNWSISDEDDLNLVFPGVSKSNCSNSEVKALLPVLLGCIIKGIVNQVHSWFAGFILLLQLLVHWIHLTRFG